jgi:NhaP-type Na+/H+ or K+/H+ antiporter
MMITHLAVVVQQVLQTLLVPHLLILALQILLAGIRLK